MKSTILKLHNKHRDIVVSSIELIKTKFTIKSMIPCVSKNPDSFIHDFEYIYLHIIGLYIRSIKQVNDYPRQKHRRNKKLFQKRKNQIVCNRNKIDAVAHSIS